MGATPGANKARKAKLVRACDVNCGHCKYHRGENTTRHPPRPDRYKNHRRKP